MQEKKSRRAVTFRFEGEEQPWVVSWRFIALSAALAVVCAGVLLVGATWNTRGLTDVEATVVRGPIGLSETSDTNEGPAIVSYSWEGERREGEVLLTQGAPGEDFLIPVNSRGEHVRIVQNNVRSAWETGIAGGVLGGVATFTALGLSSLLWSIYRGRGSHTSTAHTEEGPAGEVSSSPSAASPIS